MNLARLAQLIGGQGETVKGCDLSTDEAATLVQGRFPQHSFCLVQDWAILDLETTYEELEALHSRSLEPVLIYALHVVHDSRGRFNPGDWLRSSFQLSYEEPGFFLTKNTVYVLLGKGTRQQITVQDLINLQ
ncbi:hypothetical protein HX859_09890 [Pseudomonas gingeri]|uniref:DUF6957 family protein n=1 Tax=Pseudomonas gingeri TaxID=117681 RepID=UPI0015A3F00A|nr:hypothetical protein [Pseudomonas gingeri]NVZ75195.1 hypothetical protein [Pseudomonas gingeri]